LAANGVAALANAWSGLIIDNGAEDNVVGLNLAGLGAGNRIACNGNEGVAVYDNPTVGNVIRGNSVFSNNYIGINLVGGTENSSGVTANHIGGAVSGPNDLQNHQQRGRQRRGHRYFRRIKQHRWPDVFDRRLSQPRT
jgi:hypothetical protein